METFCPRSTTAQYGYCPSGAKPRRKKKNNPESGTLSRLLTIFAVAFLLVDLVSIEGGLGNASCQEAFAIRVQYVSKKSMIIS
jgi:hypothetical protein